MYIKRKRGLYIHCIIMILILEKIIVHPQLARLTSNNDSLIYLFVA